MIDQGGARMRESEDWPQAKRVLDDVKKFAERLPKMASPSSPLPTMATVTFSVTETHDGEACDCIDQTMTLTVGQEIELTHVCHDGRVDKVVAKITAIKTTTEHGKVESR